MGDWALHIEWIANHIYRYISSQEKQYGNAHNS
jgi:hypothetical protein